MDKLTDLNSRRVKDSTVIVLNRFSKKLVGFLSIETDSDHFRFTDQKEFLWIIPEVQAVEMKKVIPEEEEFFVFTKNEETGKEDRLSSRFLRFEVAKIQYQK